MFSDRRALIALLGALAALPPLSIDLSLPGLPVIAAALHAPSALLQWTLSAFIFGFGLGQLALGPLSDRIGRRPVLIAGLAVYVAAGIACTFSRDAASLVTLRALQGVAACSGLVCARAIVTDVWLERAEAARVQAYLSVLTGIAPIVAPILGTLVLGTLGWRALYGTLAVAGIVLLGAVVALLEETSPRSAPNFAAAFRRAFALPTTLPLAALCALAFGAYFAIIASSPFALVGQLRLPGVFFPVAFGCNAVASFAGSIAAGRFVGRFGATRMLLYGVEGLVVAGVAVALADVFAPSVAGYVATMAAYAFAFGVVMPSAYGVALAEARSAAGTVAGVLGAAQMLGGAGGSALAPALALAPAAAVAAVVLPASLLAGSVVLTSRRRLAFAAPLGAPGPG